MKLPKKIAILDFETYFDKDYSLKKMSTTNYIRDTRFKAQGVGIRMSDEKCAKWYSSVNIKQALGDIDWSETGVLCHHSHFDGGILSYHFDIVPCFYFCTLSMARPLHGGTIRNDLDSLSHHYGGAGKKPDILGKTKGIRDLPPELDKELGEYCEQDVDETFRIFKCMVSKYPKEELFLIDITVRAYADPVFDTNKVELQRIHDEEIQRKNDLLERLGIEDRTELRSNDKLADKFRLLGIEPPKKISPTTGKTTYAFAKTDIGFQKLAFDANQDVVDLQEARLAVKSDQVESRAQRMIEHSATGPLPIYLAYGKAHTLRWAGGDKMNPQNLGRDTGLRECMVAPEGFELVIGDSAQIEARMNAWLAGEEALIEAFRNGYDIYSEFAGDQIYNRKITKKENPIERFVGKTSILGLGFNMGVPKFKNTLEAGTMGPPVKLEEELYAKAVYGYRNKYTKIVDQWGTFQSMLAKMYNSDCHEEYGPITFLHERVLLPNGMELMYPNIDGEWNEYRQKVDNYTYSGKKIYGGLFVENVVQSLARLVVAYQALMLADKYRIVLLVHDEIVLMVPTDQVEQALIDIETALKTPLDWCPDLPLDAEVCRSKYYKK